MKTILMTATIAVILSACGGGGSDDGSGPVTKPNATAGGQKIPGVSLRACETTGQDAPPCPATAKQ